MSSIEDLKGSISRSGGMARSNLFRVQFPTLPGIDLSMSDMNLICKDINLPGRQVTSIDKNVGGLTSKIAIGQLSDDVSATFLVMNDYGIKKYFEEWQRLAFNPNTLEPGYKSNYARDVSIVQLAHLSKRVTRAEFQATITNTRSDFDFSIRPDHVHQEKPIYECKLINAYPTTLNAIQLNNDLNGLVELNVQLSYDRWISK